MTLEDCRVSIDEIDEKILELLNDRMKIVQEVGHIKEKVGGAVYRPEREQHIINRLSALSQGLLNHDAIEAIYLEIFAISRNLELPERIAYLGPRGSYTHQAAESRFGAMSSYLSLHTISNVFSAVQSKRAKFAVVPLENNNEGNVGETLYNLSKTNLKIIAELQMPIHHSLASKEEDLKKIKKIYSKDIAFSQCQNFLHNYDLESVELIPVESTAKASELAKKENGSAAICSKVAAKLNTLPILFENIEDSTHNKTRFIILSDFSNKPSGRDKTTILDRINHSNESGALAEFLKDFGIFQINLKKIESYPIKDSVNFTYQFYIDFDGHMEDENVKRAFKDHKHEIIWLGSYVRDNNEI